MESISIRSHARALRGARSIGRVFGWFVATGSSPNPVAHNRRPRDARVCVESGLSAFSSPWRRKGVLHSVCSARADEEVRSQGRRDSSLHGSLSRPVGSRQKPPLSRTGATATCPSFSRVAKVTRDLRRSFAVGLDRAPARPAGVSEVPTFRMGRAHDRFAVAEVGRTASSSWTRAAPGDRGGVPKRNASRGNLRGASDRPSDGRRSGSSVPAGSVTGHRGRVILAARSQTPLTLRGRGSPLSGRKPARESAQRKGAGGAR